MNSRSVSIKGTPKTVAKACKKIYSSLEKFASSVDNVEKVAVRIYSIIISNRNLSKLIKSRPNANL
jgi:hypothetical protein